MIPGEHQQKESAVKKKSTRGIYFGWWTVAAASFLSLWGWGYQMYGFSALFKPLATELGFSRAVTSVASGIGRFGGGFEAPITGWLTDRFGPRRVMLFGISLFSIGLILMYFVNSLWAFYVVWGIVVGTGANTALALPVDKALTNWFVKKRGLAVSIRWMFAGLLLLPLITWLIDTRGWRLTCVFGGLVMLAVGLPLTWFCVRDQRPEYYGLLPDGAAVTAEMKGNTEATVDRGIQYAAEVQEIEFTFRQAVKVPAYWLLLVSQTIYSMTMTSLVMHFIPFLTDIGMTSATAATTVTIAGIFSIATRFTGGFLADRVAKNTLRFLYGGTFLIQSIGIATYVLNPSMTTAYSFLIIFYIGMGASLTLMSLIAGRYFGRKAFGSIQGSLVMLATPLGIAAPFYTGWVYDTTGDYMPAFILFAILLFFAGIIALFNRPPRVPTGAVDARKFI